VLETEPARLGTTERLVGLVVRKVVGRDVVWVWPEQFEPDGLPYGFALRVDRFMGLADARRWGTDRVWVCGSVFDPDLGGFRDRQVTLVISVFQPLAQWDDGTVSVDRERLVAGGRVYGRGL
jgi:hypothetical protein